MTVDEALPSLANPADLNQVDLVQLGEYLFGYEGREFVANAKRKNLGLARSNRKGCVKSLFLSSLRVIHPTRQQSETGTKINGLVNFSIVTKVMYVATMTT